MFATPAEKIPTETRKVAITLSLLVILFPLNSLNSIIFRLLFKRTCQPFPFAALSAQTPKIERSNHSYSLSETRLRCKGLWAYLGLGPPYFRLARGGQKHGGDRGLRAGNTVRACF